MIASGLDAAAPASDTSPRFALRAATAAAHARVDALYSSLDLSRPDDYTRFLTSHAAAYLPVEQALARAGADDLVPGWSARRRGAALSTDLAAMGLAVPPAQPAPAFDGEAEILGGLYVLEGSRLGGAVLVRSVTPGLPTAFLAPEEASSWRGFVAQLDRRLASPAALNRATQSALAVFAVFERCARAVLEPTVSAE